MGGVHQFFFNSSGSYYELIENTLISLNEPNLLDLLHKAKQIAFPEMAVPVATNARRERMFAADPDGKLMDQLDALDQQFYRSRDTLSPKLDAFARENGLV